MKKGILLLFTVVSLFTISLSAQTECPAIISSSFQMVNSSLDPCDRMISFDYVNPTSDEKRINLSVFVDGIQVINECIDVPGENGVQKNFVSQTFKACSASFIDVSISPYSGKSCTGIGCIPFSRSLNGSTLPVIISSFTATKTTASTVVLQWVTLTEINNRGFAIERNSNGSWEQTGFVRSQSPDGNSSSKLNYQFTDINYNKGITQYRIKQTDLDGKSKYSEIRAVRGEQETAKTVVFPNPASDGNITVLFSDAAPRDISVLDMTGRTVKQWKAYQQQSLQVNNLVAGMYSIRAIDQSSGKVIVEKIIINK